MKLVSIVIINIALILSALNMVACQTVTVNSQQSKKFHLPDDAGVKFEIIEKRRPEYIALLPLEQDNATKLLITEGSSSTEGRSVTNEYPRQLAVLYGGNYYEQTINLILNSSNLWTVRNVGNSGDTMLQMTTQYATQVLPFYNPFLRGNYLTLQGGSNDIANGRTTAALKADVAAYVVRAKFDGFIIGVCTVFHRAGNDVGKVNDYNNWVRTGNSGADFIIDLAANPALGNAANLTYFQGDGIHTNNAGQTVIAGIFADSIPNITASSVSVSVGGRAVTTNGRGIRNVVISLIDAAGNIRTARTLNSGNYRFRSVVPNQTYTISAKSKLFEFVNPSQVLHFKNDINTIDFVAKPR